MTTAAKPTRADLLARGLKVLTRMPAEDWGAGWAGVVNSAATWDAGKGASFETMCWRKAKWAVIDTLRREDGQRRKCKRKGGNRHDRERQWGQWSDKPVSYAARRDMAIEVMEQREQIRYLASLLPSRQMRAMFLARSRGWLLSKIGAWCGVVPHRVSQLLAEAERIVKARAVEVVMT